MLAQVTNPSFWVALGTVCGVLMLALHVWQFVFSVSINSRTQKIEKLGDQLNRRDDELSDMARKMVDQQLANVSAAYRTAHEAFARDIQLINDRMARGETRFAIMEKKDHQLEVKILEELRKIADVMATKSDLDRLRKDYGKN